MKWRPPNLDPDFPLSRQEYYALVDEIVRSEVNARGRSQLMWVGCIALVVAIFCMCTWLGWPRWLSFAILIGAFILAGVVFNQLSRKGVARNVCSRLRLRGHELCVACGYWLRGLSEDVMRCPECGAQREPMIAQIDQTQSGGRAK